MWLTRYALRNPIAVAVICLLLVVIGIYAYFTLGISLIPNVTFPGVTVVTTLPGADPQTIETQITKPIEDAIAQLSNVDTITSTSSEGRSVVNVQFTSSANVDLAPINVERAVNSVQNQFPAGTNAPSIQQFNSSAIPVEVITLSGPQSANELQQLATNRLQRPFQALPGVQSVQVVGGSAREIHVEVNVNKLVGYQIGLNQIQTAIASSELQQSAGILPSGRMDTSVVFDALSATPQQLKNIVVSSTSRGNVRLGELATISDGFKKDTSFFRVDGKSAIALIVRKLSSANTLVVSHEVDREIKLLAPSLPAGTKLSVVFSLADYTQQSFNTVQHTLIEAIISTGLILLIFLHTWRSTLIVLVAIPTSLLTAIAVTFFLHYDLNLFTMLALTLSVGILVDDSIVILENIYRHLFLRELPVFAAINGRSEIGFAAITITFVDVVVYAPIAFIPNVAGQILGPFALVIASATLTSLLVSFTLTPLLASRILTPEVALQEGSGYLARFGRKWNHGFAHLTALYSRTLDWTLTGYWVKFGPLRLRARFLVVLIGVFTILVAIGFVASGSIGVDLFPTGDQSEVDATLTMPPTTATRETERVVGQMLTKVHQFPEVREYYSDVTNNTAQLTFLLVPINDRKRSSAQIAESIRKNLDPHLPGEHFTTSLPNAFAFSSGSGGQDLQIAIRGDDPTILSELTTRVEQTLRNIPGAVAITSSSDVVQPQMVFHYNRAEGSDLGISAQLAAQTLALAVNGQVVGEFQQPGRANVDIRLRADQAFRSSPPRLVTLPLLSSTGQFVQLGQVGSFVSQTAPLSIDHYNRQRSITVSASVEGRPVGSVIADASTAIARIPVPPGYSIQLGSQSQTSMTTFADLGKALLIGILLVYILMTFLFRSFTLPFSVLVSLPLASFGALGAMVLTKTPFTLFSALGFFLLVGLVGKNAILLVDYTHTLRKRGRSRTDALREAGPIRLRPIVMTTMSVIVALVPVAIGIEAGSELLKASAIVLIGGLLTSTLLTLVFVPAMYTYFDDLQELLLHRWRRLTSPRELTEEEKAFLSVKYDGTAVANNDGYALPQAHDDEVVLKVLEE
ncbi:MAG: efflux RND transporter permease subunit [Chloroflexi bacterium]|nr:efflux RND transporter permease subunit [Chloroflexota bacterium]